MKISIIYWTSTGNTEKVAEYIAEGIKNASDVEVNLVNVSKATSEDIELSDLIVFGSSAMGVEAIDDSEMAPFIDGIKELLNQKKVAVFGSYDWGDGEWLREWSLDLNASNADVLEEYLMIQNTPEAHDIESCHAFSKYLLNQLES